MDNAASNSDNARAAGLSSRGQPADDLIPQVYEELRRLARARLAHEAPGQTLQPTALVHEAYLRLLGSSDMQWHSHAHFFAAAARSMREILVERARRHRAVKHGGGRRRLSLDDADIVVGEQCDDLIGLDEALRDLEQRDQRKGDIVMLRFFAGLTVQQTATALSLSPTTVKDEWAFARAWLHSELTRRGADDY